MPSVSWTRSLDERLVRMETMLGIHGERLAMIEATLRQFCKDNGRPRGVISVRDMATVAGATIGAALAAVAAVMGTMAGKGP